MNHEFWYFSRAAGFTAYLLLFLSVAMGIAIGTRFADRFARRNTIFDLHRFTTILALAFTVFHVYILLGDAYFSFNVWELSIPFLTPYRTLPTAAGIFSMYALALIIASFYVRSRIGYRAWRAIHFLTFALFAGALYHGITAGTDTTQAWAKLIYLGTALTTLALVLYRVQYRIPDTSTMRGVRLGAGIATLVVATLLISATGLFAQGKAPATGASLAAAPGATPVGTPVPYPFLASFNNDVSGTYQQSQDATNSHLTLDGASTGDLNINLHVELIQSMVSPTSDAETQADQTTPGDNEITEAQPTSVVTANTAELRDPNSGAVICKGKLTALNNGLLQMTCNGEGPYGGVSFSITTSISASGGGQFTGSLSGNMTRTA